MALGRERGEQGEPEEKRSRRDRCEERDDASAGENVVTGGLPVVEGREDRTSAGKDHAQGHVPQHPPALDADESGGTGRSVPTAAAAQIRWGGACERWRHFVPEVVAGRVGSGDAGGTASTGNRAPTSGRGNEYLRKYCKRMREMEEFGWLAGGGFIDLPLGRRPELVQVIRFPLPTRR